MQVLVCEPVLRSVIVSTSIDRVGLASSRSPTGAYRFIIGAGQAVEHRAFIDTQIAGEREVRCLSREPLVESSTIGPAWV
jgi:hypothetical protein